MEIERMEKGESNLSGGCVGLMTTCKNGEENLSGDWAGLVNNILCPWFKY